MLLSSTTSRSTMPMRPTPTAARYRAAGEPSPPAPTMSTEPRQRRACAAQTRGCGSREEQHVGQAIIKTLDRPLSRPEDKH